MDRPDEPQAAASLPLTEVLARPLKYLLSDGLSDVPWGFALMLVASLCALGRFWSAGFAYWIPAGIVSGSCVFWVPYATERLRERFIYPRGGYVSFEPLVGPGAGMRYQWLAAAAIAVLVMLSARIAMERFWGFGPAMGSSCS